MLKRKKSILLTLAALLAAGCLWYARPVGVDTLFPGLEPDHIYVTLINFSDSHTVTHNLVFIAGTSEFNDLWTDIQSLRFRRIPTNVLVQIFPFLEGVMQPYSKSINDDEIAHMFLDFSQVHGLPSARTEELRFWIDAWEYRDLDHSVNLPLVIRNGGKIGQELAHALWEQAETADP